MAQEAKQEVRLNLLQKLAKIRKNVDVIQKNKQGFGYKYVTEEEILVRIKGSMDKLGVSLIPGIVPGTTVVTPYTYAKVKYDKQGNRSEDPVNEILVKADTTWTWLDDATGERIEVPWTMVGQQSDASQAFGSGLSYSSRYFLLKYFNASTTEDDPDNWRSRQKEAAESEQREIAEQIVGLIREKINRIIEAKPDSKEQIKVILKRHVVERGKASVNYMSIKNPEVAKALLDDINKEFPEEETA